MNVEVRAIGSRSELLPRFEVALPAAALAGGSLTLRELISLTVRDERDAAVARQRERTLRQVLTERDLATATESGAIRSGEREPAAAPPPADEAIRAALEGFADGLYLVAIDGTQHTDLDAPIAVTPQSTVTYLRLVALAGG